MAKTKKWKKAYWASMALMKKRTSKVHVLPSPDEVTAAMTPRGGWTRAQLEQWGVPWPPPRGWRQYLATRYRALTGMPERIEDDFDLLELEVQGYDPSDAVY